MVAYFFLVGVPCVLSIFFRLQGPRKISCKDIAIISFFSLYIIMLGCRNDTCGVDLQNYKHIFREDAELSWGHIFTGKIEQGYHFLSKFIAWINFDFQFFLFVIAAVSVLPLLYLYKKESEIPLLTIALFITIAPFSMYFSGLRQVCAMAFAVPAYYFSKRKKPICFLLTVALAMLFHQSAFILALLYPAYHLRIRRNSLFVIVPLLVGVLIFNEQIFEFLLGFLSDSYVEKYSEYESTGAYTILIVLVVFAAYSFFMPREMKLEEDVIGLRNLLLLSVLIQSFAPVHSLAMRFNYYYLIFVPILIPKIANRSSSRNKPLAKLSVVAMCCFFTVYFFYYAYTSEDILNIYPYIPFWEG